MNDPINREEFSSFIRYHRLAIHMSQREFADLLGVTRGSYGVWESGNRMPRDAENLIAVVRKVVKSNIRKGA